MTEIQNEKHRCKHSGHFTRLVSDSSFRDYLDLFKFRFSKAKKLCHIGDLIRTHEVRGLCAESLYTGSKLAALHCFRDVQADAACAFRGAKHAEVTNDHFTSFCSILRATKPPSGRNSRLRANVSTANPSVKNEHGSFAVCDPRITHPFSVVL